MLGEGAQTLRVNALLFPHQRIFTRRKAAPVWRSQVRLECACPSGVSDYGVPAVRGSFLGMMARTEEKTVGGRMSAQETFSKGSMRKVIRFNWDAILPSYAQFSRLSWASFSSSPVQLLTGEQAGWVRTSSTVCCILEADHSRRSLAQLSYFWSRRSPWQ